MNEDKIITLINKADELSKTSLLTEITNQIKKEKEEEEKNAPYIKSPYRPQHKTLKKLEEVNPKLVAHLEQVSPFYIFSLPYETVLFDLIEKMYDVFTSKQIERMPLDTRLLVIEGVLKGFRKTLYKYRNNLLFHNMMFQEKYEDEKLKYLIEYGEEPVCVPETDYAYIEEVFVDIVKKASYRYFSIDKSGQEINGSDLTIYICEEYMLELTTRLLRKFDYIYRSTMVVLQRKLLKELYSIENNPIFQQYDEYKIKPLTYGMIVKKDGKAIPVKNSLSSFAKLLLHLNKIQQLDDKEEVLDICEASVYLMEVLQRKIERDAEFLNELKPENKRDVRIILEKLPLIMEILNDLSNRQFTTKKTSM